MSLKVNMVLDTDDTGNLREATGRNVAYVDASACGDEKQAISEAQSFMEKFDIGRLKVRYGTGSVELRTGDVLEQKAEELFYASCCFDINQAKSFEGNDIAFGNPNKACDLPSAVHSALRIAKRFDRKVAFAFNNVAVPPVEPKAEITQNDIRAVVDAFNRPDKNRPKC